MQTKQLFQLSLALFILLNLAYATDINQTYINASNQGQSADPGPLNSTVVWQANITNLGDSHVILVAGILYAGSTVGGMVGNVLAFNASNGTLIWNYSNISAVAGGMTALVHHPVFDSGRIYFDSDGGQIYALNATTGAYLWNFSTRNSTRAPAVLDGIAYVSSFDGNLYALNATTGASLWNFSMSGRANIYPPAIQIIVNGSGRFHRIFISNVVAPGMSGRNSTFALDSNRTSFIRLWNNSNYSINFANNQGGEAFAQNLIYQFFDGTTILITAPNAADKKIEALNLTTGTQIWSTNLGGGSSQVVALSQYSLGALAVGTDTNTNGSIFVLNPSNGAFYSNKTIGQNGVAALRFMPTDNDFRLYMTTTYSSGVLTPTNIISLDNVSDNVDCCVLWNRSVGGVTPSITGGGPIIVDGALFTTITDSTSSLLMSIDPTVINTTSPSNGTVTNNTRPEFNFTIQNTSFGPRDCGLWVNGTEVALNQSVAVNTNTNLTPTSNLSNGTNVWYVRCETRSGIVRTSETRTIVLNISAAPTPDATPPTLNVSVNSSQAPAGTPVLVNVTATDTGSNLSSLSVNITNSSGSLAIGCGTNTTNASSLNVNCIFTNSTVGVYNVTVIARDGAGNSASNTTTTINLTGDTTPPTILIVLNASSALINQSILINVTASDAQSNMSLLNVTILTTGGSLAGMCGTNTTNASSVNVVCTFTNESATTFIINVTARDGANNSLIGSDSISFNNPSSSPPPAPPGSAPSVLSISCSAQCVNSPATISTRPGASIQVFYTGNGPSQQVASLTADSNGKASFIPDKAGTYQATGSAVGYTSASTTCVVTSCAPTCSGGQVLNAATNTCECPSGTQLSNATNSCEPIQCSGGQAYNTETNRCECPSGTVLCPDNICRNQCELQPPPEQPVTPPTPPSQPPQTGGTSGSGSATNITDEPPSVTPPIVTPEKEVKFECKSLGSQANKSGDCCEGYKFNASCTKPPISTIANAIITPEIKSGCAGILACTGSVCTLCNTAWIILLALGLLAGIIIAKFETNKLLSIIGVIIPLIIGLLTFAYLGLVVALVEIAYVLIFRRNKR